MSNTERTKFQSIAYFSPDNSSSLIASFFSIVLIFTIRFYQLFISPFFPSSCRFDPSCSQYALSALKRFSAYKAFILIMKRIFKCHPWGSSGSDPLPE